MIMTTIVEMEGKSIPTFSLASSTLFADSNSISVSKSIVTKASSVMHNTKRVHLKNSHVKTSNVFVHNIAVMEKMVSNCF